MVTATTEARTAPSGLRGRVAGWVGAPGSGRRRLAGNGTWTSAVFVANAGVTFFLSPFVLGSLGDSAYGLWLLVLSVTGYFGFADLGIRPAVVHYVARHDALGETLEVNRYVNSAFVAFAAGGAVVLVLAAFARAWLPVIFHVPPELVSEATNATMLVALDFALTLPLNAFTAVLVGKQRYGTLGRVDLAVLALRTAAIVVVLRHGGSLVALALAQLGSSVVEMVWKTWAAFRAEPGLRFAPRLADRRRARALVAYGALGIVVALGGLLAYRTNAIVIQTVLPVAAIPMFWMPAQLAFYARALFGAASRVLTPAAGALDAVGDRVAVARLLESGARTMLWLAGPVLAYLLAVGEPFLARWMDDHFRGEPATVLAILAVGVAPPIASLSFTAVLYGVNGMRSLAAWSAVEGIANVGLSVALVRPMGIVGVAIGTAVPAIVVHGVLLPRQVCRLYGVRFGAFAARTWPVPLLAGTATFAALRAVASPEASLTWAELGFLAGLSVAVFGVAHALLSRVLSLRVPRPTSTAGAR